MHAFLSSVVIPGLVTWLVVSAICLSLRAWLLRSGDDPASLPMQSRMLAENSATTIIADCLAFVVLLKSFDYLFQDLPLGSVLSIALALLLSPLQAKYLIRRFAKPAG